MCSIFVEATLSMYHTFKNRDNIEQLLIRDKVVEFIKQKFSDSKKERFKNENVSARGNQSRRSK